MPGIPVGRIAHFFPKISVAVIELTGELRQGDMVSIEGPHGRVEQVVTSMQIDKKPVPVATKGQSIGMKVNGVVHEKDVVYKK